MAASGRLTGTLGSLVTKRALRPWNRESIQVARHIGRKDFASAIRVLENCLVGGPDDAYALELLAHCYRWSGSEAKAVAAATQILGYDGNDFSALKLLAEIHANRDDRDKAVTYIRRALENYPKPVKPFSRGVVAATKAFARIFPPLRHMTAKDFEVLEDPQAGDRTWFAWAKEYLAWYDGIAGGNSSPVLH